MSQFLAHAHIDLIISGHRIVGLAEEDRPIEFPDGDGRVEEQVGADGGVYGVTMPMYGGLITIRLQPASPSTQWFIQRNEEQKQAQLNRTAVRVYSGSYSDAVQGRSARLEGGFLRKCPDMAEPGQTFEVGIYFERIAGNVDGATFRPPLSSDAS